jgi:diguanylate cyclase (GGDEF)-like protein
LTGLPNRLLFEDRLQQAIALGQRVGSQVGLIMFDVDRFKMINDTLGHQAGDELLFQMSKRVAEAVRPGDTFARTGGDEFAVILAPPVTREDAFGVARKIQTVLEPRFAIGSHEVVTTLSMGIAFSPSDASDAQALQSRADIALYRVKSMGRHSFQCYAAGMDKTFAQRMDLEYRLRGAIERNQLSLHYQPQVDRDGRLVGLEALLRWEHPELGSISPATFIPLAEECALIVPIGAWVLKEVCRQGQAWRAAGFDPISLAVNVSAIQFTQADFCERAIQTLTQTGYDPRFLELEVTESAVMGDIGDTADKLRQLTEAGVQIAVDDFGTGHSSLAYLDGLPLHRLKIDRSFVKGLDPTAIANPARTTIVRAITSLSHNLGLTVVAEGVETIEQARFLGDIGCDVMQGYLFSRPRPADEIARLYLNPAARQRTLFPPLKAAS